MTQNNMTQNNMTQNNMTQFKFTVDENSFIKKLSDPDLDSRKYCYLTNEGKMISFSPENLHETIENIDNENIKGWYMTINPTDGNGRKKENFFRREYLVVDIDPVRASGSNSTNAQLVESYRLACRIHNFIPSLFMGCSGNGWHLIYKCWLENTDEDNQLVNEFYDCLDKLFSTPTQKIDRCMADINRLTKIYGTMSRKAPHTDDCPQRQSYMYASEKGIYPHLIDEKQTTIIKSWDLSFLIDVMNIKIDQRNEINSNSSNNNDNNNKRSKNQEWIVSWCKEHNLEFREFEKGVKLRHCPFYHEHQNEWCTVILVDGARDENHFGFSCFGQHCKNEEGKQLHTWRELRQLLEGNSNEDKKYSQSNSSLPLGKKLDLSNVSSELEFSGVSSGFSQIDNALGGGFWNKTFSIITSTAGQGKTTFCHQLISNYLAQGLSVGYYQGDLTEEVVISNFVALGVSQEQINNLDFFSNCTKDLSHENIADLTADYDVFVIDNLSSLLLEKTNYELQKTFVDKISAAVERNGNHVHLVAHQTKGSELSSLPNIEGSAEIGRKANIVLSVERFDQLYLDKFLKLYGREDEFINDLYNERRKSDANPNTVISVLKNQIRGDLPKIPMKFNENEKKFENYFQN
ncbi:MAG: hypothetical protein J6R06_05200 [Bacteroidales bacterium]|nr:hypothetical protein [Bacteroidales bacterium]